MTNHQPLAGIIRRADLGQILLVQQRELQGPLLHQFANRPAGQRRDPTNTRTLLEFVDLWLGEHPTIPNEHHPLQPKSLSQFLRLIVHRLRIARVARINLRSHRAPLAIGHDSIDNDRQPLLPIAVVTKLRQRTSAPFIKTARYVIEHQAALAQMASSQLLLNPFLPLQKPVHGLVEIILAGLSHPQLFGKGGGVPLPCGRQFRSRGNQSLDDHGYHQVSFAAMLRREDSLQLEFADHVQDGLHVAVRKSLLGGAQILRGDQGLVAQQAAKGFDFLLGPIGEIGQGALAGFVAFAPAFAEEDGGWGIAIGDGGDIHVNAPNSVILTLPEGTSHTYRIPNHAKFTIDGEKKTAFDLRKGMSFEATIITDDTETVIERSKSVVGQTPPPASPVEALLFEPPSAAPGPSAGAEQPSP